MAAPGAMAAIANHGSLYFWRLAIKPGRPVALGQIGTTPLASVARSSIVVDTVAPSGAKCAAQQQGRIRCKPRPRWPKRHSIKAVRRVRMTKHRYLTTFTVGQLYVMKLPG